MGQITGRLWPFFGKPQVRQLRFSRGMFYGVFQMLRKPSLNVVDSSERRAKVRILYIFLLCLYSHSQVYKLLHPFTALHLMNRYHRIFEDSMEEEGRCLKHFMSLAVLVLK